MAEDQQKIKVIIADQQALFRQGIRSILSQAADIEICGEAGTADELVSAVNALCPDVAILDISFNLGDNQDLVKSFKQMFPSVAVVLMTPKLHDDELFIAIKCRASGYLSRSILPDDLLATIRRAARGGHSINDNLVAHPQVAEKVLQQFQDFSWGRGVETFVSSLAPKETEILIYMTQGYSNKQIAAILNISGQTIKDHITSILHKLDANVLAQAVMTTLKMGLIKL